MLKIRRLLEKDLDRVLELENALFTSCWKKEDYLYEINKNEYANLFVLEDEDLIIAYGGIWFLFEQAQITTIAVATNYQRRGYAEKLISYMENMAIDNGCESVTLEVRVSNKKAINLYEKLGYVYLSTRKSYYSDNNEDAYLYGKGIGK